VLRLYGDAGHRDVVRQRPNVTVGLRAPDVAGGGRRVVFDHTSTWVTAAEPRIERTWLGGALVSIVMATRSPVCNALSLGAPWNVHITRCVPFQWKQRDATRGVPSIQV
jgi:hypothetical protein